MTTTFILGTGSIRPKIGQTVYYGWGSAAIEVYPYRSLPTLAHKAEAIHVKFEIVPAVSSR